MRNKSLLFLLLLSINSFLFCQNGWFWLTTNSNNALIKITFINESTGFAGTWVPQSNQIIKTTNSGMNWFTSYSSQGVYDIYFINPNTGYSVGNGLILKTTDCGSNWYALNSGAVYSLNSVFFVNEFTGYCVGNYEYLKTTNQGLNWQRQIFMAYNFRDVYFTDNLSGYFCAYDFQTLHRDLILRTTNGGENIFWDGQMFSSDDALKSIYFINLSTGFTVSYAGKVYKTTNAGVNWYTTVNNSSYRLNDIYFPSDSIGYAAGYLTMIKTTDVGQSWGENQFSGTWGINCLSVFFTNNQTGYVVLGGNGGMMLKTTTGGGNYIVSLHNKMENSPQTFSLSQNYPNPFNPSTKIKFDIPPSKGVRGMMVRLIIYDALGREIAVLVNEQLNPGSYEVEFDGSNYPSGVYFYKLVAGDYNETKKMILLK